MWSNNKECVKNKAHDTNNVNYNVNYFVDSCLCQSKLLLHLLLAVDTSEYYMAQQCCFVNKQMFV